MAEEIMSEDETCPSSKVSLSLDSVQNERFLQKVRGKRRGSPKKVAEGRWESRQKAEKRREFAGRQTLPRGEWEGSFKSDRGSQEGSQL